MLCIEVHPGMSHDETDTGRCVAHVLVMSRVRLRHHLAADQHVRRLEDGIAEILVNAADGQLRIIGAIDILVSEYLADGIFLSEMGAGERPAHHAAVPGKAPVGFVSGDQVVTEHVEESTVGRHGAAIDAFVADGVTDGIRHLRDTAALLDFREIVLQVLVQPVGHGHIIFVGDHIDTVRVLLEGIRGELTTDIHRQQEHERHRHREPHEVHCPVQSVLSQEIPKALHIRTIRNGISRMILHDFRKMIMVQLNTKRPTHRCRRRCRTRR